MTKFLCEELRTTLSQTFTLTGSRVFQISAMRPFLVMYGAPAGTFTMSIKSGANTLGSVSFTSADIQSDLDTSDTYAYINKALQFDQPLPLRAGSYTAELSSSGYTFGFTFLAWIKRNESIFVTIDGTPADETNNPFTMELWEKKRVIYA